MGSGWLNLKDLTTLIALSLFALHSLLALKKMMASGTLKRKGLLGASHHHGLGADSKDMIACFAQSSSPFKLRCIQEDMVAFGTWNFYQDVDRFFLDRYIQLQLAVRATTHFAARPIRYPQQRPAGMALKFDAQIDPRNRTNGTRYRASSS
jgi:hypothetical protein